MSKEMFSLQLDPKVLEELHAMLTSHDLSKERKTTNQFELHRIEHLDGQIILYRSGKVVSTSLPAKRFLQEMVERLEKGVDEIVLGSDESGKGEWLGPLVVCAVALPSRKKMRLVSEGVMDSKALSRERIDNLGEVIEGEGLMYSIRVLSPQNFNRFLAQLRKEGKNLNHLLASLHQEVLEELIGKIPASHSVRIVIDEFDRKKMEKSLTKILERGAKVEQRVRGEDEAAVACASIMAKMARERWIDQESRRLKIDLRKISRKDATLFSPRDRYFKIDYLA